MLEEFDDCPILSIVAQFLVRLRRLPDLCLWALKRVLLRVYPLSLCLAVLANVPLLFTGLAPTSPRYPL